MDYTMREKLSTMSIDMKIVRKLCKINEYKGAQCLNKKQPKSVIQEFLDKAIETFVYDTYIEDFNLNSNTNMIDLIKNNIAPKSREDISVLEFRDVIKTVNTAYEDMDISSETILQLHGYLHRYSLKRGGRYKNNNDYGLEYEVVKSNIDIEKRIGNLCANYYQLIEDDEIEPLIIIATFIMDFISISPFEEDNIKMAKILTLLLLNKNGYEVCRFISLGNIYNDKDLLHFKTIFDNKRDLERTYFNIEKWLNYFLDIISNSYEKLSEDLNIPTNKKETKTRRIEKIINSTLGYFTKDDIRSQCPDIPEPTINRVFNNLRKDGKIEVVAKGRSAKWKKK